MELTNKTNNQKIKQRTNSGDFTVWISKALSLCYAVFFTISYIFIDFMSVSCAGTGCYK